MSAAATLSDPHIVVRSEAEPRIIVRKDTRFHVERIDATNRIVAEVQQGRTGPAGATTTTVINIGTPALTWTLAHYLGRYPSVTLIDGGNNICEADIAYVSENIITVTFSEPVWGKAYLN